jgi:polyisoprenoid-binding protein YceI
MKQPAIIIALSGLICFHTQAQDKFFTKSGKLTFDATVPASPEKITGISKTATAVLDTKTGNLQFSVLMKGFQFERALMEEHFNENYVESNKFPKAEFRGVILNQDAISYSKDGSYMAKVKGKMSMHGETKEIEATGTIKVKSGTITLLSDLSLPLSDYKISIPSLVADKVAAKAQVRVDCQLEPLKM